MTYIMGIDVGTTGTKVTVFDLNGAMVTQRYRSYELLTPHPGWRELDPNEVLEAAYDCIRGCCADGVGAKIRSVSVSAQGGGLGFDRQRRGGAGQQHGQL